MNRESIQDERTLEFVVFCIENVAARLEVNASKVFDALAKRSDILYGYLVPSYDVLHTQGKEYIINDIIGVMKDYGVTI